MYLLVSPEARVERDCYVIILCLPTVTHPMKLRWVIVFFHYLNKVYLLLLLNTRKCL